MQILLIISFVFMILAAMFIGQAMSGGYAPYMAIVSAILFMVALFMPFLSEYNVLHRGFSKIGDNFKSLTKSKKPIKGEVEIILPGQSRAPAEDYSLDNQTNASIGIAFILVIGLVLLGYDVVQFYILGDGLDNTTGPISNF